MTFHDIPADEQIRNAATDLLEALRQLVNYNNADPDLYAGDDDGALSRLMIVASTALIKATNKNIIERKKIKSTIEINCDTEPFFNEGGEELLRILKDLIHTWSGNSLEDMGQVTLRDFNGNVVGIAQFIKEDKQNG